MLVNLEVEPTRRPGIAATVEPEYPPLILPNSLSNVQVRDHRRLHRTPGDDVSRLHSVLCTRVCTSHLVASWPDPDDDAALHNLSVRRNVCR